MENNKKNAAAAGTKKTSSRTSSAEKTKKGTSKTTGTRSSSGTKKSSASTSPSKNGKKGKQPQKKSGFSFGTLFLILLTVAVLCVCGYLLYRELTKGSETTDLPVQTSDPSEETLSSGEETSGEQSTGFSDESETVSSGSETPTASSDSTGTEPSTLSDVPTEPVTPTDPDTPTEPPVKTPIEAVSFAVPSDADYMQKVFGEGNLHCTVTYYEPKIEMPGYESTAEAIQKEIDRSLRRVFNQIEESYDPDMHGNVDYSLSYEFRSDSKNTVSLLIFYPTFGGYGETYRKVTGTSFNARTGKLLYLDDLANEAILPAFIRQELMNLELYTDQDVIGRCNAWYIGKGGTELTLLYNPRVLDDAGNEIVTVSVTTGFTEKE